MLLKYLIRLTSFLSSRLTCNSTRSSTVLQTQDNSTFNLIANNLYPYTNYSCCVEAQYTDETENANVCATVATLEGCKSLLLFVCLFAFKHSNIFFAVPGPPTNLMAVPSTSVCNEVLFNWNLPPEDERNGITHIVFNL